MTTLTRIPFGLDRLPRSLSLDDARLPTAPAGPNPLRLNTEPLPANAMPDTQGGHATHVAAMTKWLTTLCGDYAPLRRRFIATYVAFLAAQLEANRAALTEALAPYDNLYAPDDFLWSALRPLPRAWLPGPAGPLQAEIAFWSGTHALALELSARDTPRQAALQAAGLTVLRIPPDALADPQILAAELPSPFQNFWRGQTLPASPFRRPIPSGVLASATA